MYEISKPKLSDFRRVLKREERRGRKIEIER